MAQICMPVFTLTKTLLYCDRVLSPRIVTLCTGSWSSFGLMKSVIPIALPSRGRVDMAGGLNIQ